MRLTSRVKQARPILFHSILIFFLTVFAASAPKCQSQFISHINQKGLRGNVTFDVREDTETNITQLVIEATLEDADQSRWVQGHQDESEFDGSRSILFDWSLHTNALDPHMIASCSSDDSGPTVGQDLQKSLTASRPITLNKSNRWILNLDEFFRNNSAKSLSSLIWGKSLRLRLSSGLYGGKPNQSPASQATSTSSNEQQLPPVQPARGGAQQGPQSLRPPSSRISSALDRPKLAFSSTPSPNGSGNNAKPTFAPRPKPNISRSKPAQPVSSSARAPPSLPKPEALVAESADSSEQPISPPPSMVLTSTNSPTTAATINAIDKVATSSSTTTATPPPAKSREAILEATNKRILRLYGNLIVCGNIIDTRDVKTAEAVFESQIGGKITIRGNEDGTTLLMVNLYHIRSKVTTRHDWMIMASDILDHRREDEKCKYLQAVFDPNNMDNDAKCSRNETSKCRMGDLTKKHGPVQVAGQGRRARSTSVDPNLPLSALDGSRSLFLVVYEVAAKASNNGLPSKQTILSCAPIRSVGQRRVEATINMDGVRGYLRITQRHPSEPAQLSYDLFGLEGNIRHQSIRELPLPIRSNNDNSKLCSNLGSIFNPTKVPIALSSHDSDLSSSLPSPITLSDYNRPTIDSFPVGNLSAKHGSLSVIDSEYEDHYMGEFLDLNLQLYGSHSIVGRSLLIHKNNGEPWVCATLQYMDRPINLAVANFFYPVVGQITFQQLASDPHSETNVLVELYNPNGSGGSGSELVAPNHNWLIHLKPAMADFYNWSQRCESTGEVYDPVLSSIGLSNEVYSRQCSASLIVNEPLRCRVGDTSLKSGFKLSLPISPKDRPRYYYTDLYLPLSGQNSILGRSVVIYDESAPVQRGNRLACSNIKLSHPLKASVRSWDSGPSIPSAVRGMAQFEQNSASRHTQVKLDLSGFNGNVEHYAIHQVWTTDDREFPCSNDSLYDIFDPLNDDNSLKLPPTAHYGTSATVDRVKIGDLSRKHGTLEGLQGVQKSYSDANLPLFAPHSIVGRSMVLRASVNDFRWVCGNVELDYDKSETRELIGLASFDDPRAKVSGYVRFSQLEHKDGSLSDTFIQIDLRGQAMSSDPSAQSGAGGGSPSSAMEHKTSDGHNWAVFVNQVGEDAYIAADDVRCIAAGFKWNPYLAQDSLETYSTATCTSAERFGCAMGDLGLRHGLLTLGPNNRRAISDSNLPLVGNYSVMGRSLVIFDNERPSVKLACANIFPDIHLKSNVVIKRTPSFTVARFIEQMRSLLGASDWLMVPELRATKPVANGECVQMTIHFYGQRAHQIQVELNNLITLGTVRKSSRFGVEKVTTHYRLCRAGQAQLTSGSGVSFESIDRNLSWRFLGYETATSTSLIYSLALLVTHFLWLRTQGYGYR